jgi:hypothetical protein|tara:strand:- start:622 stop:891 length:270 start_codon:yes stop_codon:yes gene_type:complete
MTISLNTSKAIYTIEALASERNMEDKEVKLSEFLKEVDVKIVWKEEEKTKVGRGRIIDDDTNFVYLTGEKGTVVVNRNDIIAIKTSVTK